MFSDLKNVHVHVYILTKIKSNKSTFVFKSPENKKPCSQKLLSDKQMKFKEYSACLEINFIKICPEIALKYFFLKMWFYMKYIVTNRRWRILMSMGCSWKIAHLLLNNNHSFTEISAICKPRVNPQLSSNSIPRL